MCCCASEIPSTGGAVGEFIQLDTKACLTHICNSMNSYEINYLIKICMLAEFLKEILLVYSCMRYCNTVLVFPY